MVGRRVKRLSPIQRTRSSERLLVRNGAVVVSKTGSQRLGVKPAVRIATDGVLAVRLI